MRTPEYSSGALCRHTTTLLRCRQPPRRLPTIGLVRTGFVIAVVCLVSLAPPPIEASDGTHGTARQEVIVDTVGGRPVVTTRFSQRGGDAGSWRLVEELKLGNVVGQGPEGFGGIADLAVDLAGDVYVLDVGSKEVRVFGRDGTFLRELARDGDGPGEIRYRRTTNQRITFRAPDELWIGDGQQQMVIDMLGNELSRSAGRRHPGFFLPGEVPKSSWVIAAGAGGSLFSLGHVVPMGSPDQIDVLQHTYVVHSPVSADYEMLPGDTLAIGTRTMVGVGGEERHAGPGGSTVSVQNLQGADPRFVWTVESGGTLWLAHRSRYRFDELSFTGDTIRTVQVGDVPPLSAEESEFVPILAALASSPEGWLWVQREEPATEGGSTWDVLDNCGRYRTTVTAPVGLRRLEVGSGGALYGISSDDLGVDFVHRFRLRSGVDTPIAREICPLTAGSRYQGSTNQRGVSARL